MAQFEPRDRKLAELILHIAIKSEGDAPFGATKLNKILFRSDFWAFKQRGKSITGQEYQALPNGPAPRHLLPVMDWLQQNKAIAIRKADFFGKNQNRPLALREPNLSLFDAEEIGLVDSVIQQDWGKTATRVSEESHEFIGWKIAGPNETIPYETCFLSDREPSAKEMAIGKSLAAKAK